MSKTLHREWRALIERAHEAGIAAGIAVTPAPMIVGSPRDLVGSLMGGDGGGFDTRQPIYHVSEGSCGSAYIRMRAKAGGESRKFLNWISGRTKTSSPPSVTARPDSYYGGVMVGAWAVRPDGRPAQSLARNYAYATAFCAVIREAGIEGLDLYTSTWEN